MNALVKVNYDEEYRPTVSGRELHKVLGIQTPYDKWFPRMCEYGFEEGQDFSTKMSESTGGRPAMNHELSLDMAKEICMIQRSSIGKKCREYFLAIERQWNTPEAIMHRALEFSNRKIQALEAKIEADKEKVDFANSVGFSDESYMWRDLANAQAQNGVDIGQNRAIKWGLDNKYLCRRNGYSYLQPTLKGIKQGLFEVDLRTRTVRITPKGLFKLARDMEDDRQGWLFTEEEDF